MTKPKPAPPVRVADRPGPRGEWRSRAACRGMDPNRFFPDRSDRAGQETARRVCAACPVRALCLEDGLAHEDGVEVDGRHGVWGGTDPVERRAMERRRARAARRGAQ